MSSTKQYTPTTTARPTWREREAQKERQQREAVSRAADEAQRKKIAKTEENFPTTIKASDRMVLRPAGKFAELATKWQSDEAALYRQAKTERERKIIRDTVLFLRSRGSADRYDEDEEYEEEEEPVVQNDLNEQFPAHGRRGRSTAPDSEGWRLVTKKTRKQPRELTEAELHQKYREEFFGEGVEEEDGDMNGDLTDRNQRRNFY